MADLPVEPSQGYWIESCPRGPSSKASVFLPNRLLEWTKILRKSAPAVMRVRGNEPFRLRGLLQVLGSSNRLTQEEIPQRFYMGHLAYRAFEILSGIVGNCRCCFLALMTTVPVPRRVPGGGNGQ